MIARPLLLPAGLLLSTALAAAPAEQATRLTESPLSTANLANTAMGLLVVLGVMLALAWLVRRFMQAPGVGRGAVRVLGGVSLGTRERAVLVAVDRRRLLIGVAPGQVRTLADLGETDEPENEAVTDLPMSPFATQLGRMIRRPGDGSDRGRAS
jgi:flagellar protein FliO/FliZ